MQTLWWDRPPASAKCLTRAQVSLNQLLTLIFGVMRPLIRVSLFKADSENDFTLLEDNGEYFVSFGDKTGPYREFVQMLFDDDEPLPDLLTGNVRANFLALMKLVSERWNDRITADVFRDEGE